MKTKISTILILAAMLLTAATGTCFAQGDGLFVSKAYKDSYKQKDKLFESRTNLYMNGCLLGDTKLDDYFVYGPTLDKGEILTVSDRTLQEVLPPDMLKDYKQNHLLYGIGCFLTGVGCSFLAADFMTIFPQIEYKKATGHYHEAFKQDQRLYACIGGGFILAGLPLMILGEKNTRRIVREWNSLNGKTPALLEVATSGTAAALTLRF